MFKRLKFIFVVFIFPGILIGKDEITVNILASKCNAGKQDACNQLIDIARNDKSIEVRKDALKDLNNLIMLAKLSLEDSSLGDAAFKKFIEQASLDQSTTEDWRTRVLFKYITSFNSVPNEHKYRLMNDIMPGIRLLCRPEVISEVGFIETIKTEWKSTYQIYTGQLSGNRNGEIITFSIKVQKIPEPLSQTWNTSFPFITSSLSFLSAEIDCESLLKVPIQKMTDQNAISEIARKIKSDDIRLAAIENHNFMNEELLAYFAKNDLSEKVREAAISKLTSQKILADIAKNEKSSHVLMEIAEKINDQALAQILYSKVVINKESSEEVRLTAVRNLNDQKILADIVKNEKSSLVLMAVAEKINDKALAQTIYSKIVNSKEVPTKTRAAAAVKINDNMILVEIARKEQDNEVKLAIITNSSLTDQVLLIEFAKNDQNPEIRKAAVTKLYDQNILSDIAKNDKDDEVRKAAIENSYVNNRELLMDIVKNDISFKVRNTAIMKLSHMTIATDSANNKEDIDNSIKAVENLTDQSLLAKIALEDSPAGDAAFKKLFEQVRQEKTTVDDWRTRVIFKFISAFESVPTEDKERIIKGILPAIRVLSLPDVVSEIGFIEYITVEWKSTNATYTGGLNGNRPGEIIKCSVKVQKLNEPLSYKWSTAYPYITSTLNFLPAEIRSEDLFNDVLAETISDDYALTVIARMTISEKIRIAVIKNPSFVNKEYLAFYAKNDGRPEVRKAAIKKLTNQALLKECAMNDPDSSVRETAVLLLSDSQALSYIAKNDASADVRKIAVGNVNMIDQKLLFDIAKNDKDIMVRTAAVYMLKDQKNLLDIIKYFTEFEIRKAAVEMLSDNTLLTYIAKSFEDNRLRIVAIRNSSLTDINILTDIAKNEKNNEIRAEAERKLAELKKK